MIRDGYDVMQVCTNGHCISTMAVSFPHHRRDFCKQCGAATIMSCTICKAPIPGFFHVSGVLTTSEPDVPQYCVACGSAYPWQQAAIANAIEVLEELGVGGDDLDTVKAGVTELIAGSPKTEVSALRLKRILSKLGKPAYDIGIKVVSDLVSETVKKTLFQK